MARAGEAAPTEDELMQRRLQAMKYRVAGYTYQMIGDALGISANQAHSDVHWCIVNERNERKETREQALQVELDRCEMLIRRLTPKVDCENPDNETIDRFLKVQQRIAKLQGLDAASKHEHEINDNRAKARRLTSGDLVRRMEQIRGKLEARGLLTPANVKEGELIPAEQPVPAQIESKG